MTLEPDVAQALRARAREQSLSFKEVLNAALRVGLGSGVKPRPFRQNTASLGLRAGVNLDRASQLADALEDEEIVRKLELRK